MTQLFTNNAETTLSAGITSGATIIPVVDASVFPSPSGGDFFLATLDDGANIEVVKCTGVSVNDLTVVRAHEGTAAAYITGDQIELRITQLTLDSFLRKDGLTALLLKKTTAGITAFATGGQASAVALVSDVNEIAVCATAGDSVKLPAAAAGQVVHIINNGAAACDVFPASGDNIGAGVDLAVSLAVATGITYACYDATNWIAV